MKAKNNIQDASLTGPLLEDVKQRDQENFKGNFPNPTIGSQPLAAPDSYQDSGGGYNTNLTYPQQ